MKKEVFMMMSLMLSMGMLCACSKDEAPVIENEVPNDSIHINPVTPEVKPFIGVRCMEDSVQIQLQLLNSDSVAMDTFKEGEDIIFKLTIMNISNELVMITPINEFSDDNIFNIYSSNGSFVGKPWDGRWISLIHSFLTPGMLQEHTCSWLEEPVEDTIDYLLNSTSTSIARVPIRYYKQERRKPLPKGSYYTQFDVSVIEGRTTTIRMDFNIE